MDTMDGLEMVALTKQDVSFTSSGCFGTTCRLNRQGWEGPCAMVHQSLKHYELDITQSILEEYPNLKGLLTCIQTIL